MSQTFQDRFSVTDNDRAVLDNWLEDRLHELHTAHPAHVVSFDKDDRTATIRLEVRRDIKGQSTKIAPLIKVPVQYPASESFGMTWPIKSGDKGLAIFCESSIDRWWTKEDSNSVVNPRDLRMHDYSDAIFIPHIMRRKEALSAKEIDDNALTIYGDGVEIKLTDDGKFCIETPVGEFLDILTQALDSLATTPPNPAATALSAQIKLMKC